MIDPMDDESAPEAPEAMDDADLLQLLEDQHAAAVGHTEDSIASEQDDGMKRYLGLPYGDEQTGMSQVISHDCAQVVDWALPDLLEPFVGGDNIVEFDPVVDQVPDSIPPDQRKAYYKSKEEQASQATDYCNYVFSRDNPGFEILHDVAKAGLIQKIGIAKVWWDVREKATAETRSGLNLVQLQQLQQTEGQSIVGVKPYRVDPDLMSDMDAQQMYPDGISYDVELRSVKQIGRIKVQFVPPDEFKVSPRSVTLKDNEYVCHESMVTSSDLVEMGFDPEKIEALPGTSDYDLRRSTIRFNNELRRSDNISTDESRSRHLLLEEYILADRNGDGIAEQLKVLRVENEILSVDEVEEHPFADWSPMPLPGRLWGEGLVDKTAPTQRVNTILMRQMLDNLYLANTPQREVADGAVIEDGSTYSDLLNPQIGSLIRVRQPGMIREIATQDRSQSALRGLGYMTQQREMDSGIMRNALGVTAEEIDPKSATESKRMDRGGQARKRLMARVFAERFLRPLFGKMLRILIKHQTEARIVQIRGDWVPMDPRPWSAEMGTTIKVGLGFQNRDEQMAAAMAILGVQAQAFQLGFAKPEHLYATAEKIVEAAGFRFAEKYFVKPDPEAPPAPEKPDPKLQAMQAEMAAKQEQMQAEMQLKMQQHQFDAQLQMRNAEMQFKIKMLELQAKQDFEAGKRETDYQQQLIKIDREYQLGIQQASADMQLRREQMGADVALQREKQHLDHDVKKAAAIAKPKPVSNGVRFGGEVG